MTNFFLISPRELMHANIKGVVSIESRKAYDAENSELTYIGSQIMNSGRVYDYHVDEQGRYWYRSRMRLQNGQIVSMEEYLSLNKRKKHRQ